MKEKMFLVLIFTILCSKSNADYYLTLSSINFEGRSRYVEPISSPITVCTHGYQEDEYRSGCDQTVLLPTMTQVDQANQRISSLESQLRTKDEENKKMLKELQELKADYENYKLALESALN